ncbi:hypothetical protein EYV94_08635 [Puteibacter caeruleilacunae]|nr:hypothetical protein EYV94_08635 [Puteibacter caeruleilacunae]
MKTTQIVIAITLLLTTVICSAQNTTEVKWYNPLEASSHCIEGQFWPKEVEQPYDRLPVRAKEVVRKPVWNLSQQSAGLKIRFTCDAPTIQIRYTVGPGLSMPHMPATGDSGIDLYTTNKNGQPLWCAGKYSFGDTIRYTFQGIHPNELYKDGFEYVLYLPLYNSVKTLEIGVPQTSQFEFLPVRNEKPIVTYGTSIMQGACASRPGMAWTNIISRRLHVPLINFGFSGNGKLESEVIDFINEIDARLFILDCLPNLTPSENFKAEEVAPLILNAIKQIRAKHPKTPIILTQHGGYPNGFMQPDRFTAYQSVNKVLQDSFIKLLQDNEHNLFILPSQTINLDIDSTVDGVHPNDLGMHRYAKAYEQLIRKILKI